MDDIIQQAMSSDSTLITATRKTMGPSGVDQFTAYAVMRCAEVTAKPDTNCDPDCLIVKSVINGRD